MDCNLQGADFDGTNFLDGNESTYVRYPKGQVMRLDLIEGETLSGTFSVKWSRESNKLRCLVKYFYDRDNLSRFIEISDNSGGGYTPVTSVINNVWRIEIWGNAGDNDTLRVYNMKVNGSKYNGLTPVYRPLLTFADPNPDLKYFKPGDVIKSDGETNFIQHSTFPLANAFDATKVEDDNINASALQAVASGNSFYIKWGSSFENVLKVEVCLDSGTNTGSKTVEATIKGFDVNGPVELSGSFTGTSGEFASNPIAFESLNSITFTEVIINNVDGPEYAGLRWVKVNDEFILGIDPDTNISVSVISTDLDNNQMTVDGGTWNVDDRVTYGPVTGEGTITNIDEATNTYTISPNNGRFIDWTNSNSGVNFTHTDLDPSPQQFAVRLKVMPYLDANNPRHLALYNNLEANMNQYKLNYIAPDETFFFDYKTQRPISATNAYSYYGLSEPDNKCIFKLVNRHPSYAVRDYVRYKDTYYAVHDITEALKAIRDKIEELQNP